ncbi:alpha/beta fold hydrolase [Halopseudomonas sp.]|uniref:alpha/beta fold hydrolase n=1 Tax=Halopseudomonas sp. TaxID=2901191 RepID=UPI00311DDEF1
MSVVTEQIQVASDEGGVLQIQRLGTDSATAPVILLLHGAMADSRLYLAAQCGLAGFLAEQGYCVYLADLRGHGASQPTLEQQPSICSGDLILRDIPALLNTLVERHARQRLFVLSHGWGGVWLASALIRQPQLLPRISGLVQLGVRRRALAGGRWVRFVRRTLWGSLASLSGRLKGRVPARALGLGSQDEARAIHAANLAWERGEWRDLEDGFDYASALNGLAWPPSLYLAGDRDRVLGHIDDVRRFARELGRHDAQVILLEKGRGCSRHYGHSDLLTHPQAEQDHFPLIADWLAQRRQDSHTQELFPCGNASDVKEAAYIT